MGLFNDIVDDFEYYVDDSDIHGRGVFAKNNIGKGKKCLAIVNDNGSLYYADLGKYINHSKQPNCGFTSGDGMKYFIHSLNDINQGDEMTVDYDNNPHGFQKGNQLDRDYFEMFEVENLNDDRMKYRYYSKLFESVERVKELMGVKMLNEIGPTYGYGQPNYAARDNTYVRPQIPPTQLQQTQKKPALPFKFFPNDTNQIVLSTNGKNLQVSKANTDGTIAPDTTHSFSVSLNRGIMSLSASFRNLKKNEDGSYYVEAKPNSSVASGLVPDKYKTSDGWVVSEIPQTSISSALTQLKNSDGKSATIPVGDYEVELTKI